MFPLPAPCTCTSAGKTVLKKPSAAADGFFDLNYVRFCSFGLAAAYITHPAESAEHALQIFGHQAGNLGEVALFLLEKGRRFSFADFGHGRYLLDKFAQGG